MKKNEKLNVKGLQVGLMQTNQNDFICITDIAKYKNPNAPADIIKNWLRTKNTIELLGLWEKLYNRGIKVGQSFTFLLQNKSGSEFHFFTKNIALLGSIAITPFMM